VRRAGLDVVALPGDRLLDLPRQVFVPVAGLFGGRHPVRELPCDTGGGHVFGFNTGFGGDCLKGCDIFRLVPLHLGDAVGKARAIMQRGRKLAQQRQRLADFGGGRRLWSFAEPAAGAGLFPGKHPGLGFLFGVAQIELAPPEHPLLLGQGLAAGVEPRFVAEQMLGAGGVRLKVFVRCGIRIKRRQCPEQPGGRLLAVLLGGFKILPMRAKRIIGLQRQLPAAEPVLKRLGRHRGGQAD